MAFFIEHIDRFFSSEERKVDSPFIIVIFIIFYAPEYNYTSELRRGVRNHFIYRSIHSDKYLVIINVLSMG